jgi:hypothetical protein
MRVVVLLVLSATAAVAQTLGPLADTPEGREQLRSRLFALGWTCQKVTAIEAFPTDHYGDSWRVTCWSASRAGSDVTIAYRVSIPHNSARPERITPWGRAP